MTTIACNRKEMAGDPPMTVNDVRIANRVKVHRVGGAVIGCAGKTGHATAFLKWYGTGEGVPSPDDDFAALVLTKEGIFWYDATLNCFPIDDEVCAVGGGADLARGAMAAGASPEEAVEIAVRYDVGSGPPVVVERLNA